MLKYKKGNLVDAWLDGEVDVLIHQCNCYNTFGSGIAKEIRERIPEAYDADCKTIKGDVGKLGDFTVYSHESGRLVYNLYGQYGYGRERRIYTSYPNLFKGLLGIQNDLVRPLRIGIPKLGCGLGGGDWSIVEGFVKATIAKENVVTVYEL